MQLTPILLWRKRTVLLAMIHLLLVSLSFLVLCEARNGYGFPPQQQGRWPLAGIFGLNGNNEEKNKHGGQQRPPPPPPPPRAGSIASAATTTPTAPFVRMLDPQGTQQDRRQRPPPPPPPTKDVEASTEEQKEFDAVATEESTYNNDVSAASHQDVNDSTEDHTTTNVTPQPWAGSDTFESYTTQQQQRQQRQPPPTQGWMGSQQDDYGPPPPPPMNAQSQQQQHQQQQQGWHTPSNMQQRQQLPPPPSQYYNYDYNDPQQQQQQQQQYPGDDTDADFTTYLQVELNDSLSRESSLVSQLDNLTSTVVVMEQREELHTRQLDVLTERVMDVEAQAVHDRNLVVELEANCTALGTTIVGLQEDLEEWQQKCRDFQQRHDDDQHKLNDLRKAIKAKQSEAEELAIAMEQLRIVEKRREANYYPASQKQGGGGGGMVSWVLSWFGLGGGNKEGYDSEAVREESFEMAKSTLLRALQSERSNVHELEGAVASLQQNNSLISEMVESRDSIIDELNNRIAVFEEDKVVLKAALRQLQKEMNEEAPKTQKLLDDLASAEEEINRLKSDIHAIIETHQEELVALQSNISQKQKKITDAESNLTAIGTYVDKLEDRLTSFAITRRDMDEREKKCKEIEKAAEETEEQRKALQTQVEEFQGQQDELKKLLEELASERTNLQKENRKLYTEREFRIGEQEQLDAKVKAMETEKKTMESELQEWKDKCEKLLPELEISKQSRSELERQLQLLIEKQSQLERLQSENMNLAANYEKVKADLAVAEDANAKLESQMVNMTKLIAEKEKDRSRDSDLESKSKNLENNGHHPPPPPSKRPPGPSKQSERKVPLRSLRKKLSQATGMHGLITPSSKMVRTAATPSTTKSSAAPRVLSTGKISVDEPSTPNDRKDPLPPPPLP